MKMKVFRLLAFVVAIGFLATASTLLADEGSHRNSYSGGSSSGSATTSSTNSSYKVIATNDLGMHCACPDFGGFVLLPPYNTIRAQVIRRGSDPSVVSSGVSVSYSFAEENDASLLADPYYATWIDNAPKIFPGFQPVVNGKVQGLAGNGIEGTMTYNSTSHAWVAEGIPAYPVVTGTSKDVMSDPLGGPNRDPFLTANITVKDTSGNVLATTSTVVPVAFGGCCSCHLKLAVENGYPATKEGSFEYLGYLHGQNSSHIDFSKIDPDGDGKPGPIRCSWCHWDPAMGESSAPGLEYVWPNFKILPGANFTYSDVRISQYSFSDVLHRFHSQNQTVLTEFDPNIANDCYACHPGNGTNCYRGTHKGKTAIWCSDCHGNLNERVATNQLSQPWQQSTLPTCFSPSPGVNSAFACHSSASIQSHTWPGLFGQFINGSGHEGGILCESCHGEPHGLNPSTQPLDNVENANLQSFGNFPTGVDQTYAIGVCNVCHTGRSNTWNMPPHGGD